jgi:hypothetical protein
VTRTKPKRSSDRSKLPGGPATIWISRNTHRALNHHARSRGQKIQWLADHLIMRGLASAELN